MCDFNKCVQNMLNFIKTDNDLVYFVKHFNNNETGFMFCSDPRIIAISNAVDADGHSGASFACCLRNCQYILNTEEPCLQNNSNVNEEDSHGTCSICLNDIEDNFCRTLSCCKSSFHIKCIQTWILTKSNTCPMCRSNVTYTRHDYEVWNTTPACTNLYNTLQTL